MMELDEASARFELPMERRLFSPPSRAKIDMGRIEVGTADFDARLLLDQIRIDKGRLKRHVKMALKSRKQVTLSELVALQPLEQGLAELLAYLQLGEDGLRLLEDPSTMDTIAWAGIDSEGKPVRREAQMPRVIFLA